MAETISYRAAGGVVVHSKGLVLVLERPSRHEIRLPKGHVDTGENALQTALREIGEEAGFRQGLHLLADLGVQHVAFTHQGACYERDEHYFLLHREGTLTPDVPPEDQFRPRWLTWEEAERALTFAAEREWVRRAHAVYRAA